MKRAKLKENIKKKIENRRNQHSYIIKRKDTKSQVGVVKHKNNMNDFDKLSSQIKTHLDGISNKQLANNNMNNRTKLRIFGNDLAPAKVVQPNIVVNAINEIKANNSLTEKYIKGVKVDYDVVFCVSSYERYEKIDRILKQLFEQKTKYSFKFILLNDGSLDPRYNTLQYKYPDITYLKNDISGGKINYWKTINYLWGQLKDIKFHAMIQLDDDFILCDNFIDRVLNSFFETKERDNKYMIMHFHLYNFANHKPLEDFWFDENEIFVDGGMIIDIQFLKIINYQLDRIAERVTAKSSSFVWVRIKEKLIEFKLKVYRSRNSLVWHDGNDDSKLHPSVRKLKRVYTKNFIDNVKYKQ